MQRRSSVPKLLKRPPRPYPCTKVPIATSAKPISTRSARPEPSPTSNDVSSASATTSPSNQSPCPHDPTSTLKPFSWQPTSASGAPLWMKMVAARADLSEPSQRAIVLRLTKLRWLATPSGSPARAARGTILCRPRERGARVAVSRLYLRRHGRLHLDGGEDGGHH